MASRILALLMCAFSINSFASPSTVDGQIFVVTKSQQAVKLALVTVVAIPEKTLNASFEPKLKAMTPNLQRLSNTIEQKKREVIEIKTNLKNADGSGGSPFLEMEELSKVCEPTPDVEAFLKCGRTPNGRNAFDRTKALQEQYKKEVELVNSLRKEIRALMKEHRTATAEFKVIPHTENFAEGSADITKTDVDGKFSLSVPYGQRVAILANSKRAVADSTESYQWAVWFIPKKGSKNLLVLANDNLLETGCAACVQTLKMTTYPDINGYPEYIEAR